MVTASSISRPRITARGSRTAGTVLLGNGDGTLPAADQLCDRQGTPLTIAIGDLNGDGKPDLVTANDNNDTVSVFLGNGDGTFQAQTTYARRCPAPLASRSQISTATAGRTS